MAAIPKAGPAPPATPAGAPDGWRRKREREHRIVDALNAGKSVAEIARAVGVGEKRLRAILRAIVADQGPAPPMAYVAREVDRLNCELVAAFEAMGTSNLKAVDRIVRAVRDLDHVHGFVPARRAAARPTGRPSRARTPLPASRNGTPVAAAAFGPALSRRAAFAAGGDIRDGSPQAVENTTSAPGDGAGFQPRLCARAPPPRVEKIRKVSRKPLMTWNPRPISGPATGASHGWRGRWARRPGSPTPSSRRAPGFRQPPGAGRRPVRQPLGFAVSLA